MKPLLLILLALITMGAGCVEGDKELTARLELLKQANQVCISNGGIPINKMGNMSITELERCDFSPTNTQR